MELSSVHLTRQADLVPEKILKTPVTIIGAGAVGSFTALSLAKMGFEDISVWDFDKVSIENMNCQFYRFKDIGSLKVDALRSLVEDFTGQKITAHAAQYGEKDEPIGRGVLIVAVDSMRARKMIWDRHKGKSVFMKGYIDPRMGAEDAAMYVVDPMDHFDIGEYELSLHTDEDSIHERCTAKSTIYTANLLSGTVVQAVRDILVGRPIKSIQWSIKNHDMVCFKRKDISYG